MDLKKFLQESTVDKQIRNLFPLFLLLFVSFFYKLLIILNSKVTFFSDDAIYASLAKFWYEGRFNLVFHPTWPPLYPFFAAIAFVFTNNWENSLRVVSALSLTLTLIPLYFLLVNRIGKITTIVALLIFSFYNPLLFISIFTLSDSLAIFLTILGLTFFYFGLIQTKINYYLLASTCFGLLYLTRSEGTLFFSLSLIFLLIYLTAKIFIEKKLNIKRFVYIPLFIVVFFITASTYLIATSLQLGYWTLSAKFSAQIQQGHAFEFKNQTTWSQEVVSIKSPNYKSVYFNNGTDYLLDNFVKYSRWFDQKLVRWQELFLKFYPLWSIPIILVGILGALKRNFWGIIYLIYLLVVTIPVTIFMTPLPDIRYLAWTIPLIIFFLLVGLDSLVYLTCRLFNLKFPKLILLLISTITLLKFPLLNFEEVLNPIKYTGMITSYHYKPELINLAKWIRLNSKNPQPKIMIRREAVEFYSNGQTIYLPQAPLEITLKYAKRNKVDYIIAWDNELEKDNDLKILLDENLKHPSLKKVYILKKERLKIIVYTLI